MFHFLLQSVYFTVLILQTVKSEARQKHETAKKLQHSLKKLICANDTEICGKTCNCNIADYQISDVKNNLTAGRVLPGMTFQYLRSLNGGP